MDLAEKLMANIIKTENCWQWAGIKAYNGYGRLFWNGKTRRAHRLMWEYIHGPIPYGMWVLHRCDNPPCCNPEHLFIGTPKDNAQDRNAKGRHFDRTGIIHSAETKRKISAANMGKALGKKLPPFSAEHRAKISAWHKGRPLSPEHRAKIAIATKAALKARSERVKVARMAEALLG